MEVKQQIPRQIVATNTLESAPKIAGHHKFVAMRHTLLHSFHWKRKRLAFYSYFHPLGYCFSAILADTQQFSTKNRTWNSQAKRSNPQTR